MAAPAVRAKAAVVTVVSAVALLADGGRRDLTGGGLTMTSLAARCSVRAGQCERCLRVVIEVPVLPAARVMAGLAL